MSSGPDAKRFCFQLLLDFASIYTKSMLNASVFFVTKYVDMYHINAFCINFLMNNASALPTHFVTKKNQNVPIVTLVQNAFTVVSPVFWPFHWL